MGNWLFGLITNSNIQKEAASNNSVDSRDLKRADWLSGLFNTEETELKKQASFDDERQKQIKNLSTDALAHIYAEILLTKENRQLREEYVEEYSKAKEAVLKNREKIEKAVFAMVPKHSQEEKFKKWASATSVIDVDNIWIVKKLNGKEVIVRATPDSAELNKVSEILDYKTDSDLLIKNDIVKNKSFDLAEIGEVGVIDNFDNFFVDSDLICCNFKKSGRVWLKPDQVEKLSIDELKMVKTAEVVETLNEPLSNYMRDKYKVLLKDAGVQQLKREITAKLGKDVIAFSEIPQDILDKVTSDFVQDPEYAQMYDTPIQGQPQKTDDMLQQIPVVFRNQDDGKYTPNTKDFGEVYQQDKMAPAKVSHIKLSVLDVDNKIDKTATVQYYDETTKQVKKPEELGITNVDTAPEEVKDSSGKVYKKQKLQ